MANILLSYRRADAAIAGRIFDRLASHYGPASVFMDIDNVPIGSDFRARIEAALLKCSAVVAIIGRKWAGPLPKGKFRIADPLDPVRVEIELALTNSIPILPILVDGASMPTGDMLPDSLSELAFRNATDVDAGRDFHSHMDRLIRSLDSVIESQERPKSLQPQSPRRWLLPTVAAAIVALGIGIGFVGLQLTRETPRANRQDEAALAPGKSRPPDATDRPANPVPAAPNVPPAADQAPAKTERTETPLASPQAPSPGGSEPGTDSRLATGSQAPVGAPPAAQSGPEARGGPVAVPPADTPRAARSEPATAPAGTKPAANGAFRDCATCPELIALPAGTFMMGSAADPTERPVHKVSVPAFAVGRFPVTVREWQYCVADKGCSFDPGGEPDTPVHNLSWDDAQQYLAWLSRLTNRPYRMLSEAEWEYAARANTTTRYWWGNQFQSEMAACRTCSSPLAHDPPKVGSYQANGFGLHDMTGSVSQWVADCWHKDFKGAPANGTAWNVPPRCPQRILRGGSWTSNPEDLRITSREFYDQAVRYPGHGFRVARDM